VWVLDVYPAGEKPLPGISGRTVVEKALQHGKVEIEYAPDPTAVADVVAAAARPGDTVITLGAGDVWRVGDEILARLNPHRVPVTTARSGV
jgi:UDP-N-acetylmuramate--alanine ligase